MTYPLLMCALYVSLPYLPPSSLAGVWQQHQVLLDLHREHDGNLKRHVPRRGGSLAEDLSCKSPRNFLLSVEGLELLHNCGSVSSSSETLSWNICWEKRYYFTSEVLILRLALQKKWLYFIKKQESYYCFSIKIHNSTDKFYKAISITATVGP